MVACGKCKVLLHACAVGRREFFTSVKMRDGWFSKPNAGSSSAPVTNCNTWPRLRPPLLPPIYMEVTANSYKYNQVHYITINNAP